MAGVKLILRVPSAGLKIGDEITVENAEAADALVANGTARRAKPGAKSDKD